MLTFALQDAVSGSTIGALFIAVPSAFESMGGLALVLFAGWRIPAVVREELFSGASPFWQRQVPRILFVMRYAVPPMVAVLAFFSLRETVSAVAAFLGD